VPLLFAEIRGETITQNPEIRCVGPGAAMVGPAALRSAEKPAIDIPVICSERLPDVVLSIAEQDLSSSVLLTQPRILRFYRKSPIFQF
jgi:hypothetical protein